MNQLLEPLVKIPGVRLAALISHDGVPIASSDGSSLRPDAEPDAPSAIDDLESFSALVAGWLGDIARTVDALSWDAPQRVVMNATRGGLVLSCGPGAVLVVVVDHGVSAEELRIPMDSTLARMKRVLRTMGSQTDRVPAAAVNCQPQSALPSTGGEAPGSSISEQTPASRVTENNG